LIEVADFNVEDKDGEYRQDDRDDDGRESDEIRIELFHDLMHNGIDDIIQDNVRVFFFLDFHFDRVNEL